MSYTRTLFLRRIGKPAEHQNKRRAPSILPLRVEIIEHFRNGLGLCIRIAILWGLYNKRTQECLIEMETWYK